MAEFPPSKTVFSSRRYLPTTCYLEQNSKIFLVSPLLFCRLLHFYCFFVFSLVDDVDQPFCPRVNLLLRAGYRVAISRAGAASSVTSRPIHHFHDSLIASFTNRLATEPNSSREKSVFVFRNCRSIINFGQMWWQFFYFHFSQLNDLSHRGAPLSTARFVSPRFEAFKSLSTFSNWDLCCNWASSQLNSIPIRGRKLSTFI